MNVTHGMDVTEVEDLGHFLQNRADRLNQIVQQINRTLYSVQWEGGVAVQFGQQHWPGHRARLQAAASDLRGLGQSALNSASEQRSVSAVRSPGGAPLGGSGWAGAAGIGFGASAFSIGSVLRSVNDVTSLAGSAASSIRAVKGIGGLGKVGDGLGIVGDVAEGFTIGEELVHRRYLDAGLDSGLLAGDHVADAFKAKPTPVSYLTGAAIQTWVEVAREARNVDWSANGMRAIQQASLSDWGGAFAGAVESMPSKLVSIFSW
jgi:hypothetical protein